MFWSQRPIQVPKQKKRNPMGMPTLYKIGNELVNLNYMIDMQPYSEDKRRIFSDSDTPIKFWRIDTGHMLYDVNSEQAKEIFTLLGFEICES